MPVIDIPKEFLTERIWKTGFRGIFVGGCIERKEGSSFRRKAHAHTDKTDPYRGWMCVRNAKRLYRANGKPSKLLVHEVAHFFTPREWHSKRYEKKRLELERSLNMSGRELAEKEGKNWNNMTVKEKYKTEGQAHLKDLVKTHYNGNGKKKQQSQEIGKHPVFKAGNGPTRNTLMLQAKDRGIKNFRVMNKAELEQVLKPGITQEETLAVAAGAVERWKKGRKK